MISGIIKGGLLGGLVLFVWGFVSWVVLPWHNMTMKSFKNEAAVEAVLKANAERSGVYILPNPHRHTPGMTAEQKKAEEQAGMERMMTGPLVFASVRLGGGPAMTTPMMISLLNQIVAAILVSWMVMKADELGYMRRVFFITLFAVAAGAVTHVPYWNWWSFPDEYTLVAMADLAVGWFLAGLVIAKVANR